MLGYTRQEFAEKGLRWDQLTPPELLGQTPQVRASLKSTGRMNAWEKVYLRKDGSRLPVLVALAALDGDENIAVIADLSERRRAEQAEAGMAQASLALRQTEEQLRQSQKMDAMGRLAGGVAHDFNNMLSIILLNCEQLLEELAEADPRREEVKGMLQAGQQAASLTRQLLMFSRRQVMEPRVLSPGALISEMEKMMKRLLREDIELALEQDLDAGRILADPGSLEQLLINLLVNARDAMPGGGRLLIAAHNVELLEGYAEEQLGIQPGRYVRLEVRDEGVGMDEALLSRIFEPFFTTKEVGKGTGLGLATVFGIVKQNGGHIRVQSQPGRGSSFKVYFPRVEAPLEPSSRPAPALERGSERILLVEDEGGLRNAMRALLERLGYDVLSAATPGEALRLAEAHPGSIELLLSDVVMPEMGGPALAGELSRLRPGMKVLFISGYSDDAALRLGILKEGTAFLQKPVSPESLGLKIRELLSLPAFA
jgi:signal transduction histidine kinase